MSQAVNRCYMEDMKSENPPLDHHYIPQFLLQEWTVDGKLHRPFDADRMTVRGPVFPTRRKER
jgi:hypothetical protein